MVMMLSFFLIALFRCVVCETDYRTHDDDGTFDQECIKLKAELERVGYLTVHIRDTHDDLRCNFLPVRKSSNSSNVFFLNAWTSVFNRFETIFNASSANQNLDTWFYGSSNLVMPEMDVFNLLQKIWPNIIGIFIMILAVFIDHRVVGLISGLAGLGYTLYFWSEDGLSGLIVSSVGFMELFNVVKTGHIYGIFTGNCLQVAIVFLIIYLENTVFSWMLLLLMAVVFSMILSKLYRAGDIGSNNMIPSVILLIMNFVKVVYVMKNDLLVRFLPVRMIIGVFNIAFPHGQNWSFVANILVGSRIFASEISDRQTSVYVYILNIFFSLLISILLRALIGSYLIRRKFFDISWFSLFNGFKLYIVNYDTMKHSLYGYWSGRKLSQRRVIFDLIMTICSVHEVTYALDFFIVRLLMSVLITAFDEDNIGKSAAALNYDIKRDTSWEQCQTYPQKHSESYFDLGSLSHITANVFTVFVTKARGESRGVCTILKNGDDLQLMTVAHVLDGAFKISVKLHDGSRIDLNYDDKVNVYGSAVDSIVSVDLIGHHDTFDGLSINRITKDIKDKYPRMLTVIPSALSYMINVTSKFRYVGGCAFAAIDLQPGDSGSPTFGLGSDGSFVIIGVVSHGRNSSSGNGFSTFLSEEPKPEFLAASLSAASVAQCSKQALSVITSPTVVDQRSKPALSVITSSTVKNKKKLVAKKMVRVLVENDSDDEDDKLPNKLPDLTTSECQSLNDILNNLVYKQPTSPPSDDDDDDKSKKRKKKNIKSGQKESSARKRQMSGADRSKMLLKATTTMEKLGIDITDDLLAKINGGDAIVFNKQRSWKTKFGDDGEPSDDFDAEATD